MSKVPTFVQAVDWKYYKNPVLYADRWFIVFDDDDPPEIVFKDHAHMNPYSTARRYLTVSGVKGRIKNEEPQRADRLFPPDWSKFIPAHSMFFNLVAPIPIPRQHEGCFDLPNGENTFYRFVMTVPTEQVLNIFHKDASLNSDLVCFLTGVGTRLLDQEKHRRKARNQLLKQHPVLAMCKGGVEVRDYAHYISMLGTEMIIKEPKYASTEGEEDPSKRRRPGAGEGQRV